MASRLAEMRSRGAVLCGVAAALLLIAGVACSRATEPASWTPEEIKQLTDVTDETVNLVQNLPDSAAEPANFQTAVQPLIAAIQVSRNLIERRSREIQNNDRLIVLDLSDFAGCVDTHTMIAMNLSVMVEQLEKLRLASDEGGVHERLGNLTWVARNATGCATQLTELLSRTKNSAIVDEFGPEVVEIYAVATAFRTAAGLDLKALLTDQVVANERIVARLKRKCERKSPPEPGAPATHVPYRCVPYTVARDALPKLRSVLSLLGAKAA